MTLIPWQRGKPLVWEATCVDTLAASHLPNTSKSAGSAAETAESLKRRKYATLCESYMFVPFAVETLGPWDVTYCGTAYDGYLCWGPTESDETVQQLCPDTRLSIAVRTCNKAGKWLGRTANETGDKGWTNFTMCYPYEVRRLFSQVYSNEGGAQLPTYMFYLFKLLFLTRSLRNNRTRIHRSLFSAMIVQVVIRLTVYIDQALVRNVLNDRANNGNVTIHGIDNMPYLCEGAYILLEYAISCMFIWMFIEGLYLHKVVTANALRENTPYLLYYVLGWGLPLLITAIWASLTAVHYYKSNFDSSDFLSSIASSIKYKMILVSNMTSNNRKAVRAALLLLPLLGITNLLSMVEPPLDGSVWVFGIWSYLTHFMRSFQGLFIAMLYCFTNAERRKYATLCESYMFVPFAVETLGPWGPEAMSLYQNLSKRLIDSSGDQRAGESEPSVPRAPGRRLSALGIEKVGSGGVQRGPDRRHLGIRARDEPSRYKCRAGGRKPTVARYWRLRCGDAEEGPIPAPSKGVLVESRTRGTKAAVRAAPWSRAPGWPPRSPVCAATRTEAETPPTTLPATRTESIETTLPDLQIQKV
ncbi:hypothetical protein K1T71_000035 [Dendrolimus kikuchii]|uniref:Uncharacterized protein n=1 Tax=Dendrolimus kikuchii TaxID=765133 RepID=A0ACC1DJ21_9NEOP|nr:hypothetical protein K1T71_000035 [Dendrolimus kikuchii]